MDDIVKEWLDLVKKQEDEPLSDTELFELKRLNHLVMEITHEVHNNNMIIDRNK